MRFKQKIISSILSLGLIISNLFISNATELEDKNILLQEITNNTRATNDWKNHWASSSIQNAMNKEWVVKSDIFRPQDSITRGEFVKIFNKVFKLTKSSGKIFSDTKTHWAKNEIDIAVTNGVCNGKTSTEFKPNDPITREEAAVMIANYKKIADNYLDKLNSYKDGSKVSSWAKPSVEGIIESGYMGAGGDLFNPKNKITRAETIVTLERVLANPNPVIPQAPPSTTPPTTNGGINDSTTVYVTPSGKSYHKTKNCTTLKRSNTILNMTLKQAKAQGKSDPCNLCVR